MGFQKDKAVGLIGEECVKKILVSSGMPVKVNDSKSKNQLVKWDIESVIEGKAFKIEVKFDCYATKSGNIAIEYFNSKTNKPSGITSTEADIWVHVLDSPITAWATSVKSLKEYLNLYSPLRIIKSGGDKNADLLLYKKEDILNIFHNLRDMNVTEFKSCLKLMLQ